MLKKNRIEWLWCAIKLIRLITFFFICQQISVWKYCAPFFVPRKDKVAIIFVRVSTINQFKLNRELT